MTEDADHEEGETKRPRSETPVQIQTRPATMREVEENIRVEATSLPGRRMIGGRAYCGTVDDLKPADIIGRDQPRVVQDSRTPARLSRFSKIMERAAHCRALFTQRTEMQTKTYILAKNHYKSHLPNKSYT